MIDCYSAATANGLRVICMLEELELPYRPIWVDISRGEQRGPAYLKINPQAAIPAIVDHNPKNGDALVLSQSGAILLYLAEKTGKLLPAGPSLPDVLQWFFFSMTDVASTYSALALMQLANLAHGDVHALFVARMGRFLNALDQQLTGRQFVVGEISIADIALYPMLTPARLAVTLQGSQAFPNVADWSNRMSRRERIDLAMSRGPRLGG